MRKKTIHELREEAIYTLARRSDNFDTDVDVFNKARHAMNCFYRLGGMDERLLYLENDERWHDSEPTHDLQRKAEAARERVRALLKEFNADITYSGYLPSIIDIVKSPGGGVYSLHLEYWYERD